MDQGKLQRRVRRESKMAHADVDEHRTKKKTEGEPNNPDSKNSNHGGHGFVALAAILAVSDVALIISCMSGHWGDWWFHFLLLPVLVCLCSWLGFEVSIKTLNRSVRVAGAVACITAIIFSAALVFAYSRYSPRQFSVQENMAVFDENGLKSIDRICLTLNDGPTGGTEVWPFDVMLFLAVTNQSDSPFMVDSFSFELWDNDHWHKLRVVPIELGDFYYYEGVPPTNAIQFDIGGHILRKELENRILSPHEQVEGWLCLEAPNPLSLHGLRMRLRDTAGRESIETVAEIGDRWDDRDVVVAPPASWTNTGRRDITKFPIKSDWSDW
jgi:hypothetical protein